MRNQVENPRYLSNAEIIYLFMPVYSNKSAMFISLFVMGIDGVKVKHRRKCF